MSVIKDELCRRKGQHGGAGSWLRVCGVSMFGGVAGFDGFHHKSIPLAATRVPAAIHGLSVPSPTADLWLWFFTHRNGVCDVSAADQHIRK